MSNQNAIPRNPATSVSVIGHWINGKVVVPENAPTRNVFNPATGKV